MTVQNLTEGTPSAAGEKPTVDDTEVGESADVCCVCGDVSEIPTRITGKKRVSASFRLMIRVTEAWAVFCT